MTFVKNNPKASFSIATTPRCRGGCYIIPWIAPLYPWSLPYNAECSAKQHQVPFFESLVWLDLGSNTGLLDHWRTSGSTRLRHRLLWHCSRCDARRFISPIPVYYLPRLCTLRIYRLNERKWFYAGKGKKQKIPCTNYYRCGLHWWHSASGKYTCPGWISAT